MMCIASLQLAKKYHPDVNKDSQAQTNFQEVSEAYEVSSWNDTDDRTLQHNLHKSGCLFPGSTVIYPVGSSVYPRQY